MKVSIIAPLGTSPPVVTEFLQYVQEALFQRVSDLTVIATAEKQVVEGVELVKEAVRDRYPHVHVHVVPLEFSDIDTQERNDEFMIKAAKVLRDQKKKHRADVVYICVAGGRRDMCVNLVLLAQIFDVNAVFHVVMPDVKTFNVALERARYKIEELAMAEDKRAYYLENKEELDPLMYPPLSRYYVIRVPILPFPRDALIETAGLLSKPGRVPIQDVALPTPYLWRLKEFGLVKISGSSVYPQQFGLVLGRILREIVEAG